MITENSTTAKSPKLIVKGVNHRKGYGLVMLYSKKDRVVEPVLRAIELTLARR